MSDVGVAAATVIGRPAVRASLDERTARELLRITREMVTAAHADDWEAVTRHDTSRRQLLDKAAAVTPVVAALPDTLTEALIAADTAVLERARRARDAVVDDTHRVRAERDARDKYARVMSDAGRSGT